STGSMTGGCSCAPTAGTRPYAPNAAAPATNRRRVRESRFRFRMWGLLMLVNVAKAGSRRRYTPHRPYNNDRFPGECPLTPPGPRGIVRQVHATGTSPSPLMHTHEHE